MTGAEQNVAAVTVAAAECSCQKLDGGFLLVVAGLATAWAGYRVVKGILRRAVRSPQQAAPKTDDIGGLE